MRRDVPLRPRPLPPSRPRALLRLREGSGVVPVRAAACRPPPATVDPRAPLREGHDWLGGRVNCPKFAGIENPFRYCCAIPGCHRSRASEHSWCHAHVISHAASARGGYLPIEQARAMVRDGARADDWMADENDWIAS